MSQKSQFPDLFESADAAAGRAQREFLRTLFWNLAALVAAAALSVLNSPGAVFAWLQIAALAISLGCILYLGVRQPQKIWYNARALAESVKTIALRYMLRAEPYDLDDAAAATKFASDLQALLRNNKDVSKHIPPLGANEQITAYMTAKRSLSLAERKKFYREERIADQLAWYKKKALFNIQRSNFFFGVLVALNVGAILFAVMRLQYPGVVYWPTDIFIAAAGSIMAWVEAKRFRELSASYTLTAHEIGILQTKIPSNDDERAFSLFVGDAENAFSREHVQWLARRDQ